MAASGRLDLSSGSPDRPTYPSGRRGDYASPLLSGSYCDGAESGILSTVPSMMRNCSTLMQGDLMNFFHGFPFEAKLLPSSQKLPRQGDVNRTITATLGVSSSDSSSVCLNTKLLSASSLEELKRVKTSLHDHSARGRERAKSLAEVVSSFDKTFQNVLSRRRTRSDLPLRERSNVSLSVDRRVPGRSIAKSGMQSHVTSNGSDNEPQIVEDKTKNAIHNKRARTSLLDPEPPGDIDNDKELFPANAVQSEDKEYRSTGADGWETSRMKKKRSGMKSDTISLLSRPPDGDQESKREMLQRPVSDVRSKSSNIHGFRSGPSNGGSGAGKLDISSSRTVIGMRSTPRTDQDIDSHPIDRRDHSLSSDKERSNTKAINRSNVQGSNSTANLNSTSKVIIATRGPRSGLGVAPKLSSNVHQSVGLAEEWAVPQSTNKLHVAGATNRKRTSLLHSPAPPVTHWTGQRQQKIPRVARRSNFLPLVPSHGGASTLSTAPNVAGSENGLGFERRFSGTPVPQNKLKSDPFSSAALSESEESEPAEIKSKDKGKSSCDIEEKGGKNVQKAINVPLRKNKLVAEELGLGDGVWRQGRTGRGSICMRPANLVTVEKQDNAATVKQLRSLRPSNDKLGSKTGRLLPKKISDRKVHTRAKHVINAGASEFHGESDDGHEVLLAAANGAVDAGNACSSTFWRQMEPVFGLVSDEDIMYLKQLGDVGSSVLAPPSEPAFTDASKSDGLFKTRSDTSFANEAENDEQVLEQLVSRTRDQNVPSLCQRLLSALIPEEDDEEFYLKGDEHDKFDSMAGFRFKQDAQLCDSWNQRSLGNIQTVGRPASNGYRITASRGRVDELENKDLEYADTMGGEDEGKITNYSCSFNGVPPDRGTLTAVSCTQYNHMSMNERLLQELQSIGIFPETMPDLVEREDDAIADEISRLEEKLHKQVLKKKEFLCKLEKPVAEASKVQERELEHRALDKLVGMAYEKYMACWGPNASCGRGMSGKRARQAALAFINRTLKRVKKFEDSAESCFSEPVFMDVFRSLSSLVKKAELISSVTDSAKQHADTPTQTPEVSLSLSGQEIDKHSLSGFRSADQTTWKEDAGANTVKRRELLLDDVGGNVGTSLKAASGIGSSLISGAKGKRSERDRDGKYNRAKQVRGGTAKVGRPLLGNVKGERKSKAKPKQKITQLSTSLNDLSKASKQPEPVQQSVPESHETMTDRSTEEKDVCLDGLLDPEALDLSNLQLPDMDVFGVPNDLGGQDEDLGSWLNIDEDGLQENDFVGLQIPMDDLSGLNMMV